MKEQFVEGAEELQEGWDVEEVHSVHDLSDVACLQDFFNVLHVPLANAAIEVIDDPDWALDLLRWVAMVVLAVVEDLVEALACYQVQDDVIMIPAFVDDFLDEPRCARDLGLDVEDLVFDSLQLHHLHVCVFGCQPCRWNPVSIRRWSQNDSKRESRGSGHEVGIIREKRIGSARRE